MNKTILMGIFLVAFFFPISAYSQTTKLVEVSNESLAVEVLNLPEVQTVEVLNPSPPVSCDKRLQIVGVTSAVYTGDLGSYWGANRKCTAEFPDSFLCDRNTELWKFSSSLPAPGLVAWVNSNSTPCDNWTSQSGVGGQIDTTTGAMVYPSTGLPCDVPHPLLCCGYR